MIAPCQHCGAQVFHVPDHGTGITIVLDASEHLGGKYELVNNEARLRLTPGGRIKTAGKGMRLHAGHCAALNAKRSQPDAVVTVAPDPLLQKLQEAPRFEQATHGLKVPSVVRDMVEKIGPEGNVDDYHDWTGHPTGRTSCSLCKREVIVAHYHSGKEGDAARTLRPVVLDAQAVPKLGAWRAWKPGGQSDIVAAFLGRKEALAKYVNHRHICPETRPAQ